MKLHVDNHGFEGNLPTNRITMKIKSSAHMFRVLSDLIYRDKILAGIREYICNAYDAHVSVGKAHVPFTVRLPSKLDTTFSVTDYGPGINPVQIGEIFWTYGESSKTENENMIGALGLGSKSAFAYTKSSFIVKNRYDGTEYTYFCFINENGEPEGSCVGEEPSPESTGITVEYAVRPEDLEAFYDRFKRVYKYWSNVKPNIIGVDVSELNLPTDTVKLIEGDSWYLEQQFNVVHAVAIMGNVAYPIEADSIPSLPVELKIIANNPFIINFSMGEVEFASSRESLSYTEFTCSQVIKRLEEVRVELARSFYAKVFTGSTDHVALYRTFMRTFSEFKRLVLIQSKYQDHVSLNEAYTRLLLGKTPSDSIKFLGTSILINDLIKATIETERATYQKFGIYQCLTRGRLRYFEPLTKLTATLNEVVDATEFIDHRAKGAKLEVGYKVLYDHDWRSKFISPRVTKLSIFDKVLTSIQKFTMTTRNKFTVTGDKVTFLVNDVGSSGQDRFKALVDANLVNEQLLYVHFNPKMTSLIEVTTELSELISTTLSGAEIKYLSTSPDLRPALKREKLERNMLKLKLIQLTKGGVINLHVGGPYFQDITIKNAHKVKKSGVIEERYMLSDLLTRAEVPYVIKKRQSSTNFYADVNSSYPSILNQDQLLHISSNLDFFNYTQGANQNQGSFSFGVFVITESQHAQLLKKGVKLISLGALIKTKIEALEASEHFMAHITRVVILSKISLIKMIYNILKYNVLYEEIIKAWQSSTNQLKLIVAEYHTLVQDVKSQNLRVVKFDMLRAHNGANDYETEAKKLQAHLEARYPLVTMLKTINCQSDVEKLMTYIDQTDLIISQALSSTMAEVETNMEVETF